MEQHLRELSRTLLVAYRAASQPPTKRQRVDDFSDCEPKPEDGVLTDIFGKDVDLEEAPADVISIQKGAGAEDVLCFARESLQSLYVDNVIAERFQRPDVPGLRRGFSGQEEAQIFPQLNFFHNGEVSPAAKQLLQTPPLAALYDGRSQRTTEHTNWSHSQAQATLPPLDVFAALPVDDQKQILLNVLDDVARLSQPTRELLLDIIESTEIDVRARKLALYYLAWIAHERTPRSKQVIMTCLDDTDLAEDALQALHGNADPMDDDNVQDGYISELTHSDKSKIAEVLALGLRSSLLVRFNTPEFVDDSEMKRSLVDVVYDETGLYAQYGGEWLPILVRITRRGSRLSRYMNALPATFESILWCAFWDNCGVGIVTDSNGYVNYISLLINGQTSKTFDTAVGIDDAFVARMRSMLHIMKSVEIEHLRVHEGKIAIENDGVEVGSPDDLQVVVNVKTQLLE